MPQDNPVMNRLLRKAKVSSTGRPSDIHKNLYKAIRRATGILPKDMARHLMLSPAGYAHVEHNGIITVTNFKKAMRLMKVNMLDILRILRLLPKSIAWDETTRFLEKCQNQGQEPDDILAEFVRVYGQS